MRKLHGIPVSPGIVIGEALVFDNEGFLIPRGIVTPDAVAAEVQRFEEAIVAAAAKLQRDRDLIAERLGQQIGDVFSAHVQMVRDPRLHQEVTNLIRTHYYTAEFAVSTTLRRFAQILQEGGALAERAHDIFDVERNLLQALLGHRPRDVLKLTKPVVVLANNLTPGETAKLDRQFVQGFVTEIGAAGGHTAIVARGMGIPAVVGTGPLLADVAVGDTVIVDGDAGCVIIEPDAETAARYQSQAEEHRTQAAKLQPLREQPAMTTDQVKIRLLANIEFPLETRFCLERGADGVGLYRTEFLYLSTLDRPSEEDHYRAYAEVVQAMGDKPVIIRTLDLGADKLDREAVSAQEKFHPFLGLRSTRLALRRPELFRPQVRAILRASPLGDARIMFPLISTLPELRDAKQIVADAMRELDAAGIPFRREIPIGMMVECPSAATLIDRFLPEVDFISIGTNDLIQYTLAVDRSNPAVADLYQAGDPAVVRLIANVIHAADQAHAEVSLCGGMSSQPLYTMLLLGLGLRTLSVPPYDIPEIKRVCRAVSLEQCRAVADAVLQMDTAKEVEQYLHHEWSKLEL